MVSVSQAGLSGIQKGMQGMQKAASEIASANHSNPQKATSEMVPASHSNPQKVANEIASASRSNPQKATSEMAPASHSNSQKVEETTSDKDIVESLLETKTSVYQVQVSAKVVKAADEILGSMIDVMA